MKKELIDFLKSLVGIAENEEITQEQLSKLTLKDESVSKKAQAFAMLKFVDEEGKSLENTEVKEDSHIVVSKENYNKITEELKEVESLKTEAQLAKDLLSAKREEVKRLYGLSVENKTDDAVLETLDKADNKALDGFLKQYTKTATENFTGSCQECGSSKVSFRSSKEDDGASKTEIKSLGFEDLLDKYDNKTMNLTTKK